VLVELGKMLARQTLKLEEAQVQRLEVGLVDLAYFVSVHDFDEEVEGLLLGHVEQEGGDEEG